MPRDLDFTWAQLEGSDLVWMAFLVIIAVIPVANAARNRDSIALGMVLSIILVHFVQFFLSSFESALDFYPVDIFSVIPVLADHPLNQHRILTSAWLHADFIHVLGNALVIALAGVPLEQRMGGKRWIAIYIIGLVGGNLAWIISHQDSAVPAIGASGAAFGILGAYMACWPEDKIEFPLIMFIRAWPVWLIAFVRLGLEIFQMYSIQSGTAGEPIAKGAPSPIGLTGHSMSGSSVSDQIRIQATARMGDLENDPWKVAGKPLEGRAERVLMKLREEGDELETRRAWLEELAENTICPVCGGEVLTIDDRGVCRLSCHVSAEHIRWP